MNDNGIGIYLDSSSNNTLTSNTANDNNWFGIYIYQNSLNNNLTNNNITNNTNDGIYIDSNSSNTKVSHAKIKKGMLQRYTPKFLFSFCS